MLRFSDVSATKCIPICRVWWWFGRKETSENLHILTRLSARENFIEFCCREIFKDLRNKPTNARAQNVLSRVINYQYVSNPFTFITIRVALREFSEHNERSNCIGRTSQRYDSCLTLHIRLQIFSLYIIKNR
jgi:hypothetical protein